MSNNYPFDAEPGESEEQYHQRKRAESEAAVGLLMSLARLAYMSIRFGIIYCFFLYAAYQLVIFLWSREIGSWKIAGLTLVFTYLMLCIIYLLKGIMLGLRANKKGWWKVLWVLCVIITCVFPAVLAKTLVLSLFSFHNKQLVSVQLLAWAVGIFAGFYVYNIYQFLTPVVPRIFYWSFVSGVRLTKWSFRPL